MLPWQITPTSPWFKSTQVHGRSARDAAPGLSAFLQHLGGRTATVYPRTLLTAGQSTAVQRGHRSVLTDDWPVRVACPVKSARGGRGGILAGLGHELWEIGPQTQASPSRARAHSLAAIWVRGAPIRAHRGVAEGEV